MLRFNSLQWASLFSGIFLIFSAAIYFDNQEKILSTVQSQEVKKNLQRAVDKDHVLMNPVSRGSHQRWTVNAHALDSSIMIPWLDSLFSGQEMSIENIWLLKINPVAGIPVLPVKIQAAGELASLTRALKILFKSFLPVWLDDFSLQLDDNGRVTAEIRLLIFGVQRE
jgi:hypothetical protein